MRLHDVRLLHCAARHISVLRENVTALAISATDLLAGVCDIEGMASNAMRRDGIMSRERVTA
jgi:hypothetical protein